jgi:glycosyltransferase involved in cell wall biosynthesis
MSMNDSQPLVSIGMPIYNGENYIRRAMDSLLAQDYQNFELNISDNASTDGTWEICQEYAARDSRIKLAANERNLGIRANFQIVLDRARGKYFMWAAADDYWYPAFISSLVNELETHANAGAAMCGIKVVDDEGLQINTISFGGADNPNRKGYGQMFWGITSPVKKKYNLYICGLLSTELTRQVLPILPTATNIDRLFVALISLVVRLRYVDRILYTRRVHQKSMTTQNTKEKSLVSSSGGPLSDADEILQLGKVIWRSKLVPWYRKLYIPVGMINLSLLIIRARYRRLIRPRLAHLWHRFGG